MKTKFCFAGVGIFPLEWNGIWPNWNLAKYTILSSQNESQLVRVVELVVCTMLALASGYLGSNPGRVGIFSLCMLGIPREEK